MLANHRLLFPLSERWRFGVDGIARGWGYDRFGFSLYIREGDGGRVKPERGPARQCCFLWEIERRTGCS